MIKKINAILSIFSILIWSVTIDLICYLLFPSMTANQNILEYILQGILFNGKYVFTNTLVIGGISMVSFVKKAIWEENLCPINKNN